MLSGQYAVVTGAGQNIGQGVSKTLAEHGASVIVVDIDEQKAVQTVELLHAGPEQTHQAVAADATDPNAIEDVASDLDRLDILVNNLGYSANKGIFDISIEEWDTVQNLTLKSGFICSKYFGETIRDNGGGSVVNIASTLGHRAVSNKIAYCAAKAGVINMTRQLAVDLAEFGIRVNSISPGFVGSPVGQDSNETERSTPPIPLGRIGRPDDIGKAVLFLSSDLSAYITGADVPVDGGIAAK